MDLTLIKNKIDDNIAEIIEPDPVTRSKRTLIFGNIRAELERKLVFPA